MNTRLFCGVHRLQFGVMRVKFSDRTDADERPGLSSGDERDCRIRQRVHVERVDIVARSYRVREGEVTLEQSSHIPGARIVDAVFDVLLDGGHPLSHVRD